MFYYVFDVFTCISNLHFFGIDEHEHTVKHEHAGNSRVPRAKVHVVELEDVVKHEHVSESGHDAKHEHAARPHM